LLLAAELATMEEEAEQEAIELLFQAEQKLH
jgi:hypothetical protein